MLGRGGCSLCKGSRSALEFIRRRKGELMKKKTTATITRSVPHELGTIGRIDLPGGFYCYTIERPWAGNRQNVSCIPAGRYKIRVRASPVVERTIRGEFSEGYEVVGVPGRSYIMFHVANSMYDLEGCIGVGSEKSAWGNSAQARIPESSGDVPTVTDSLATYRRFAQAMKEDGVKEIEIKWAEGASPE